MKIQIMMLKPHPKNAELFDDITGDKWTEFLESIKENGIIEPLIVTQDFVIVSGHQRVRACKELGIKEVECIVKYYHSDDEILKDLIETNIRQRGDIGGSAQKMGKRLAELSRIKGVRKGSAAVPGTSIGTRKDIADEFGINIKTYDKYIKLANMIPELSNAVDSGVIGTETALAMMKQLSESEQMELLSQLDATKKYTQKETDSLIAEIQALKNKPDKVQVVEKIPDDYQTNKTELEKAQKTIAGMKNDYKLLQSDLDKRTAERNEYREKVKSFEAEDEGNKKAKHQIETAGMFSARINKFIEDVAGYVWLTDEINELPDSDRLSFIKSVQKIKDWANQMEYNINNKMEVIK